MLEMTKLIIYLNIFVNLINVDLESANQLIDQQIILILQVYMVEVELF